MKLKTVAILESNGPRRKAMALALKKVGLTVSAANEAGELVREDMVVIGNVKQASRVAAAVRIQLPNVLVFSAQTKLSRASWADAVVPLPISVNDFKVRLDERRVPSKPKSAVATSARKDTSRGPEPVIDPNTQFYTFPHFKEVLFVEVKRARRYGFPLALALISFDADKNFADPLHHQLMRALSLAMRRSLRDTDYPVQYSRERVLLLMPHTDLAGSLIVARRICERLARSTLQFDDLTFQPTVSVGVSSGEPGREFGFSDLVRHANDGLAQAMARGGNRVEFLSLAEAVGESSTDGVPSIPPIG